MIHWLNGQTWFSVGSNAIQWLSISAWGTVAWAYWHHRCQHCLRPGQVPVSGTTHKVCKHHAEKLGHTHN